MRLDLFIILVSIMLVHPFITRSFRRTAFQPVRIARLYQSTTGGGDSDSSPTNAGPEVPRRFVPFPFKYHEEVDIVIDDLTNLGFGVGRKTLPDGKSWVIMVPTVLPGEEVKVKVYRNFANYSDAELVSVSKESPDRVKPPCPYFNECGGCQYQHMSIEAQRKWKRSQVIDGLERIGDFRGESALVVNEIVGSDQLFGYRSKLTPHYDIPRAYKELKIGFQKRNTKALVDVEDCIIASDNIRTSYQAKRDQLVKRPPTGLGATLLFREGDRGVVVTDPKGTVTDTVEGVTFQHRANEFFQNNPSMLGLLVQHVVNQASGPGLHTLLDTYCGSGLFALCAAPRFAAVYGVEISLTAVEAAKNNARINGITNAKFLCADSDVIFSKTRHLDPDHTVVVIDPPRKGCDESFLRQLHSFHPKRVVYVSCDPSTQARDAKVIVSKGGYRVKDVTPFDLFPQTRHIENVMVFERD